MQHTIYHSRRQTADIRERQGSFTDCKAASVTEVIATALLFCIYNSGWTNGQSFSQYRPYCQTGSLSGLIWLCCGKGFTYELIQDLPEGFHSPRSSPNISLNFKRHLAWHPDIPFLWIVPLFSLSFWQKLSPLLVCEEGLHSLSLSVSMSPALSRSLGLVVNNAEDHLIYVSLRYQGKLGFLWATGRKKGPSSVTVYFQKYIMDHCVSTYIHRVGFKGSLRGRALFSTRLGL